MSVIYSKIWQDLWGHKARTVQVILIIALGAFAIGMVMAAYNLANSKISAAWKATNPPTINLWVDPAIDENQLQALKNIEGVVEVEGLLDKRVEWRASPTAPWQPATLLARDNYSEQKLGLMPLVEGDWPTRNRIGVIKGADSYFNVHLEDKVEIRVSSRERAKTFEVGGYLDSDNNQPLPLGGDIVFFTTRERFGEITSSDNFTQIMARGSFYTPEYMTKTANRIDRHFEKLDIETGGAGPEGKRTMDPNRHFVQEVLDGIFLLMGVIGLGITGLGLFLIYNTVNAILTQQVHQIGVMKAVGAGWWQILWIYSTMVLFYGLAAIIIAVPGGAVAGWLFARLIADIMMIDVGPLTFDMAVVMIQVFVALLSPVLASSIPIFNGLRITVREAIGSYGLTGAAGLIERLLARTEKIPYTLMLIIGNAFRNLSRVVLTQLTLIGSGTIFIMVMGVSASTSYTFSQEVGHIHRYDVTFTFENPERIERIERMTLAQPGVQAVELWNVASAKIRPAGQPEMQEDDQVTLLFGLPLPAELYNPKLVAGRWLEPGDTYAIVLNERLAAKIGLGIGDAVTFYHARKKESTWHVVGLISDPLTLYSAYMPQPELALETGSVNQANTVWVRRKISNGPGPGSGSTWSNHARSRRFIPYPPTPARMALCGCCFPSLPFRVWLSRSLPWGKTFLAAWWSGWTGDWALSLPWRPNRSFFRPGNGCLSTSVTCCATRWDAGSWARRWPRSTRLPGRFWS